MKRLRKEWVIVAPASHFNVLCIVLALAHPSRRVHTIIYACNQYNMTKGRCFYMQ